MQIHPVGWRPLQVEEGIDNQVAGADVGHFSSVFDAVDGRGGNGGSDGEGGGGGRGCGARGSHWWWWRYPCQRTHSRQPPVGIGTSGGLTGEEGEVFVQRTPAKGVDRLVFKQEEVVSIVIVVRRTALGRWSAKAAETVMQENVLVGPSHFVGNGAGREGAADVAGGALMWLVCGGRRRRWLFSNTFLNIIFSGSVEKLLMAFSWLGWRER